MPFSNLAISSLSSKWNGFLTLSVVLGEAKSLKSKILEKDGLDGQQWAGVIALEGNSTGKQSLILGDIGLEMEDESSIFLKPMKGSLQRRDLSLSLELLTRPFCLA